MGRGLNINRRTMLGLTAAAATSPSSLLGTELQSQETKSASTLRPNESGPFDLVIAGGRVVDPETRLDAVRNVGIKGSRVAAISERPLTGKVTLKADGLVVAPGFIDLHAHGQQTPAAWVQAFDGVTTGLELESGLLPIGKYYDLVAKEGRPINYGASVAWTYARIAVKEKIEPDGTIQWFQAAFSKNNWQNTLATREEQDEIMDRVEAGLREGGLGIGINAGYAPGYGRKEYYGLAKLAVKYDVPTFTHVRYLSVKEPQSSFEAFEELIALSISTGAHMHICHLNSIAVSDIDECVELLRGAQAHGARISVEAYPYGAGSTTVGAEAFRGADWMGRWGVKDASSLEFNGKPLTQAEIDEMQKNSPGDVVVMHFLRPDKEHPEDLRMLDMSVIYPEGAIASDAMPWVTKDGALVDGDVWPIPKDAFAHPRSAGCFSRFISQWVRERNAMTLSDALRKTSLIPAQILETSVPQMRTKGRVQVGSDADLVVFDLATIKDNATFTEPAQLSSGFRHVVVNGTPIIRDGDRRGDAKPGKAIRRMV